MIHNHSTWLAMQSTHRTIPIDARQIDISLLLIISCSRIPSASVNARYPTPPRCIPVLNRATAA
jgi:hypothetical protein